MSDSIGMDSGIDSGSPDVQQSSSPASQVTQTIADQQGDTSQPSTGAEADNPAWNTFLEGVPELFHPRMKKHLREWDENYRGVESKYNEVAEKYKAYEPYQGVDPQNIGYGLNLLQAINTDPMKVYQMLTDHVTKLGLLQSQQQAPADQQDPDEQSLTKDPWQAQLEQRQAELDARQQKMDEYVQQQMYDRSVQDYQTQIDTQIQGLISKHGQAAVDVQDVLSRMFNQVNSGRNLDANAAFEESKAAFQRMYSQLNQGRQAPQIIPPTGTIAPTESKPVSQMNEEERQAHLVKMLNFVNQ